MPTLTRDAATSGRNRDSVGRQGDRIPMLVGDTLRVSVDADDVVMVESATGGSSAVADADGIAVFAGLAEGIHWIIVRKPGEDAERFGSVSVNPVRDSEEARMRAELADLDARILSIESKNVSVSGDGFSVNRLGIGSLNKQRNRIRAQLNSYLKQRAGRGPGSWQR